MTTRTSAAQQVTVGLCGNARKAQDDLNWRRKWTFEETVGDMVRAELEDRPELERANPTPNG
jgi:GDP-D-mannose dehydratase